jgi:uncharacterized protein YbjT (DUF2867 family)
VTTVERVLVTGAAGNVGSATSAALKKAGIPVRLADRTTDRLEPSPGTQVARLDFLDTTTFDSAVDGCDALFLLRPPPISRMRHTLNRLIDVAANHDVQHVVFSSVAGADRNKIVPHHRVETHLHASGLPFTILRPGFFAQNLGDAYRDDIRQDRRLFVPAGDGRVAFLDVRDLGEVAAAIFSDPGAHIGQGYTLTGPNAVTFQEVADILTNELHRPVRYEKTGIPSYFRHLQKRGLPLPQIIVQTILHNGLRNGNAEHVDHTLDRLLSHPPRTLRTYVHDHRHLWDT